MKLTKENVLDILKRSETISTYYVKIVNYELETESGKEYLLEISHASDGKALKVVLYWKETGEELFELTSGDEINNFIWKIFSGEKPILEYEY